MVAFTHMFVCAGLRTDPFELFVVFCTRGLKQIGLKWNSSSFLSTICNPSHFTNIRITDWLTDELKGVQVQMEWSLEKNCEKLPRPEKNRKSVWRSRYQNELELEARSLQPSALFAVCHPARLLLKRFQIRGNSRASCMFHSDEQILLLLVVPRNK